MWINTWAIFFSWWIKYIFKLHTEEDCKAPMTWWTPFLVEKLEMADGVKALGIHTGNKLTNEKKKSQKMLSNLFQGESMDRWQSQDSKRWTPYIHDKVFTERESGEVLRLLQASCLLHRWRWAQNSYHGLKLKDESIKSGHHRMGYSPPLLWFLYSAVVKTTGCKFSVWVWIPFLPLMNCLSLNNLLNPFVTQVSTSVRWE